MRDEKREKKMRNTKRKVFNGKCKMRDRKRNDKWEMRSDNGKCEIRSEKREMRNAKSGI